MTRTQFLTAFAVMAGLAGGLTLIRSEVHAPEHPEPKPDNVIIIGDMTKDDGYHGTFPGRFLQVYGCEEDDKKNEVAEAIRRNEDPLSKDVANYCDRTNETRKKFKNEIETLRNEITKLKDDIAPPIEPAKLRSLSQQCQSLNQKYLNDLNRAYRAAFGYQAIKFKVRYQKSPHSSEGFRVTLEAISPNPLSVDIGGVECVFLDKIAARFDHIAHQGRKYLLRDIGLMHLDLQQCAHRGIKRRFP